MAQEVSMGSINPPKKKDYGKNTRIDVEQSYQLAYWKDRFGISEEELIEAVRAAGGLARDVEAYLKQKRLDTKTRMHVL
jgi:Protein of unknown function (DUF3606)